MGPTDSTLRLLVGYDGHDSGRDALALAIVLAETTDAEIVLGIVIEDMAPSAAPHAPDEALGARTDTLFSQASAELSRLAPGMRAEHRAIAGRSPADGLAELATSEDASLLVIGSTRRGTLGRLIPGTTADGLIARSGRTIAVAPRGYADREDRDFRLIAVAYDGSAEAKRASQVAAALALRASAPLRAFGVCPPLASQVGPDMTVPSLHSDLGERMERELDELLDVLPASLAGQKVVLEGDPADALLGLGARAADVMVFGSHGFSRIERLLGGSVTSAIVRAAHWPVIVVPSQGPLVFASEEIDAAMSIEPASG